MKNRFENISISRWRVFVSSTSFGLNGYRNTARDVIKKFRYGGLECFEPVMMEDFGARSGQPRKVCADAVLTCDLLVGIIGVRYGSHPPDDLASYTELEYKTAAQDRRSCLMFLLNRELADGFEQGSGPQSQSQAQRQEDFRNRVAADHVCEMDVTSAEQFSEMLTEALRRWVDEDSFKRALVDHGAAFRQARMRLFNLGLRTSGATLVTGEPGTGKTKVVETLLEDFLLRRSYAHVTQPVTVRLADGRGAVEQARMEVAAILGSVAGQAAGGPTDLAALLPALGTMPLLIVLYLETGDIAEILDPETLGVLPSLFVWDPLRVTVLAETNNRSVRDHLRRELRWPAEAVVTVRDYDDVADALEQMRRDAPDVPQWPPSVSMLAEALGLHPISLRDVATYVGTAAGGSARRAAFLVREQLDAIAHEQSPGRRYKALIHNQVDHLSPGARDLLAMMTVLHPKPTLFPDEIAVALDLSLDMDDAIRLATAESDGDEEEEQYRDRADGMVAELIGRGLLERYPRFRPGRPYSAAAGKPTVLLTLHSTKRAIIAGYLPLTPGQRAECHARAEAFYRARMGESANSLFDARLRLEDEFWWDNAEEWFYHLGHINPGRAAASYAALFLDGFWWWDLYIPSDLCAGLLAYGNRPLVRAISPDMPDVVALLSRFRLTWPREYDVTRTQIFAEVQGGALVPAAAAASLLDFAERGAKVVGILHELCGLLGLCELEALFTETAPPPDADDSAPVPIATDCTSGAGKTSGRHLLGIICALLAEAHEYRALADQGGRALGAAASCYRHALWYFTAGGDDWDAAWTRFAFGEVVAQRGGDPAPLWDQAAAEANAQGDSDLLANIERAVADHLRSSGKLEEALGHYGRAVFYDLVTQVAGSANAAADACTQASYRETCSHAAKVLAAPLLAGGEASLGERLAEAGRRLEVMLAPWGGSWVPDEDKLAAALSAASREAAEATIDAISAAAFPPGPDNEELGFPLADYHQQVRNLARQTRTQPWVKARKRLDAVLSRFP